MTQKLIYKHCNTLLALLIRQPPGYHGNIMDSVFDAIRVDLNDTTSNPVRTLALT